MNMLHTRYFNTLSPLGLAGATILFSLAFIGDAHAAPDVASSGLASLAPLVLIMVIFYFLLIRPQQKKLKEHKDMVSGLKKGDKVVTGGGIYGTIADIREDHIRLNIADGVRVKVKPDTVASLENKPAAKS